MILAYAIALLLWIAIIIYATLEGADFGGGIWDFFALGAKGEGIRTLTKEAIGPVWEANNVWLTYLVVGLFTAFPIVAQLLTTALFIPFVLILIGIVLRGSSFVFRSFSTHTRALSAVWGRVFSTSSIITPFLFGTIAATVASGKLHMTNGRMPVGLVAAWLTPFTIVMGLMGLALCATIAAVYLTVEAQGREKPELMEAFRLRGFIASAALAVLGIVGLILAPAEAPILWHGLLDHALWAIAIAIGLGIAMVGMLFYRRYRWARLLVILETGAIIGTWGLAQLPYIVPPDLTISGAASPPTTLTELFICTLVGMLMLIPALWFLFHVFKGGNIIPDVREKEIQDF
jgi:cytochrome d ubiquinol oxidase subunit II